LPVKQESTNNELLAVHNLKPFDAGPTLPQLKPWHHGTGVMGGNGSGKQVYRGGRREAVLNKDNV
jgi:hypothetical protein